MSPIQVAFIQGRIAAREAARLGFYNIMKIKIDDPIIQRAYAKAYNIAIEFSKMEKENAKNTCIFG